MGPVRDRFHDHLATHTVLHALFLLVSNLVVAAEGENSVKSPGDVRLGGLFPIHEKGQSSCGEKFYDRGLQRLEAMLFAVDKINNDPNLLPTITLGVHILDSCSMDTYALNQSLEFIRASINTFDTSEFTCPDGSEPEPKTDLRHTPVVGVVGGSYSSVSMQVANLLRLFGIPQVSPASTSPGLSDKTRYELFARTVPPDTYQAKAIVDIVQAFNWSYVSTISSEGSYGEAGIEAFQKVAAQRNVCIAIAAKVPHHANQSVFVDILKSLSSKNMARAVIIFTRMEDARGILQAAKHLTETGYLKKPFHWIASDGWGMQEKVVKGLESVAEGAITIELENLIIKEFDEYISKLTPASNIRNPWFSKAWEENFNCTLDASGPDDTYTTMCNDTFRLTPAQGFVQDSKVQFVIDAVYSFAHALHAQHKDFCGRWDGLCERMRHFDGGSFYRDYLLKVNFTDIAGSMVQFDSQGDGLARYMILNYQKSETGIHRYESVGRWSNELDLDLKKFVFNHGIQDIPTSVCSLPCEVGQIKKMQQGDTCCWICDKCEDFEYVLDEFTCMDCGYGRWPYEDKTNCYDLPQQYMQWHTIYALVPIAISCTGIVLTLIVIGIFIKNNETPIVKASGRELSYMLLGGILVCYINTFVLLAKPSAFMCALQRFGVGFGFSIIYGALLTKTNRISRIFDSASRSARRPSFISPRSQVTITCFLVLIQVLATVVWLIVEPPGTRFDYPDRSKVILKCRIKDSSFLVSLLYNMLLITTSTVYAVKTRKIPENFNESKFIGFTMYTTCIIWLAFVPIYFGTGNSFEIQITTLCVAISLSASVALTCLYSPKIYIIVFHPDKNVRKLTMNSAAYKKAPTTSTCGTSNLNHGHGGGQHAANRDPAPIQHHETQLQQHQQEERKQPQNQEEKPKNQNQRVLRAHFALPVTAPPSSGPETSTTEVMLPRNDPSKPPPTPGPIIAPPSSPVISNRPFMCATTADVVSRQTSAPISPPMMKPPQDHDSVERDPEEDNSLL